MISTKIHNGLWRIAIKDEEWEFKTHEDFKKAINNLTDAKNEFGRLRE